MADTKLTSLTELAATPADGDMLYVVDVSDTTDDATGSSRKIQAKRWVKSDGTSTQVTGGGTIALGGYTLTVPATGTAATRADMLIQTINMCRSLTGSIDSTSYINFDTSSGTYLNGAAIPSSLKVYLYCHIVISGATTAYVELYNDTDGASISGSELTSTSTSGEWKVSGDIRAALASGLKRYTIRLKNSVIGGTAVAASSVQLVITP